MKSKEFINKCIYVAKNYRTLYVMGCFGAPLTGNNIHRYTNNHSYNKQSSRTNKIKSVANTNPPHFGFDCSGLIKGIVWGWSGDASRSYGGAGYGSNGVSDSSANTLITKCSNVSTDFSKIIPGEAVWLSGHIGVYIGDGLVVEATPEWQDKVQITALANIGSKQGYNSRKWTKHGKLPFIDYSDYVAPKPVQPTVSTQPSTTPTTSSPSTSAQYYPKYTGNSSSLDTMLAEVGVPAQYRGGYKARKPIAEANGISNYEGTGEQNTKLKSTHMNKF